MATYYVSSVDGDNADDGSSWALAKATIAGAIAVATANLDVIYVSHLHAENTGAAVTWVPADGVHLSIISVNRAGSDAWLAGASATTGGDFAMFIVTGAVTTSSIYMYGIYCTAGSGASQANATITFCGTGNAVRISLVADTCTFTISSTHADASIRWGGSQGGNTKLSRIQFNNCTFTTNSATSATSPYWYRISNAEFVDCTFTDGGSHSGVLFLQVTAWGTLSFLGCDLSTHSGSSYFRPGLGNVYIINCKLHATPAIHDSTWVVSGDGGSITVINSDSADTHDQFQYHDKYGSITRDTSIYASGGATVDGTACSWKIVTTASCTEAWPFVTPWLATWDDSKTAITATIEYNHDDATDSNNREIWSEIEYLDSASFPVGDIHSNRHANPFTGTGAATGDGAATWTGTGGFTNANPQKLSHSVTTAEKSVMRARVFVGEASKTMYLDPTIRIA